jgi:hypothetical protein
MSTERTNEEDERQSGGRFFREMLRDVRPEHIADMIAMLWLFGHGDKKVPVPKEGQWMLKMPHGYGLVGEGGVGYYIEPPPGQRTARPDNPDDGKGAKLDCCDTQGILELCERARKAKRPERDQILAQLYTLDLDRCKTKAVEAVELLTYDLIVVNDGGARLKNSPHWLNQKNCCIPDMGTVTMYCPSVPSELMENTVPRYPLPPSKHVPYSVLPIRTNPFGEPPSTFVRGRIVNLDNGFTDPHHCRQSRVGMAHKLRRFRLQWLHPAIHHGPRLTAFIPSYDFTGASDGGAPNSSLRLSAGILYGTADSGGNWGNGTIFSFPLPPLPQPELTITRSKYGVQNQNRREWFHYSA